MLKFKSWLESGYDNDLGLPYWGNLGAGILPFANSTKRFMLDLRSQYVNEPGTYGVWGGKIDNDEDFAETAKREFYEETGYRGSIQLIPAYVFRVKGFEYHNFLGVIPEEFSPRSSWETAGFRWVTLEELFAIEPKHPGLAKMLSDTATKNKILELAS